MFVGRRGLGGLGGIFSQRSLRIFRMLRVLRLRGFLRQRGGKRLLLAAFFADAEHRRQLPARKNIQRDKDERIDRDRNRLHLERAYLQSLSLSTGLSFSPRDFLSLRPGLYALTYLNDGVGARIEGLDIDRHDTGVHSVGLSLDAQGTWQKLNFNLHVRQGYGTLEESAVSALVSYVF